MNTKNKFLNFFIACSAVIIVISFSSALYIENFFSKRIKYKKPEFIFSQRKKMIEECCAQAVTITTSDNKQIAALYVERRNARRIFLICHGFKHSKEYMNCFLDIFPEDSLFFIDFRGHGQSEGERVTLGLNEHLDVESAVDYIKKNISSTMPLFGLGISMGGSAILRAAARGTPFDAIISDSAPSSFKDTISCILQNTRCVPYPISWLALTWYEFIMQESFSRSCYRHYAPKITCPVLLLHDEYDHLIDFKHAQKIFGALGSCCKLLWVASGTRHGKMHKQIPSQYKKIIEGFIDGCVKISK